MSSLSFALVAATLPQYVFPIPTSTTHVTTKQSNRQGAMNVTSALVAECEHQKLAKLDTFLSKMSAPRRGRSANDEVDAKKRASQLASIEDFRQQQVSCEISSVESKFVKWRLLPTSILTLLNP